MTSLCQVVTPPHPPKVKAAGSGRSAPDRGGHFYPFLCCA
jgi:hypothetical protein